WFQRREATLARRVATLNSERAGRSSYSADSQSQRGWLPEDPESLPDFETGRERAAPGEPQRARQEWPEQIGDTSFTLLHDRRPTRVRSVAMRKLNRLCAYLHFTRLAARVRHRVENLSMAATVLRSIRMRGGRAAFRKAA